MAFVILGSVGSALASGLAAVGLGTVGAAGAAGTGLAGAIGSAAGAASGIGAGISGGIASGLGALGMGTAAAPSALASAIGTGATAAAGGAGMGAASSAAMGGDPGQGALMGAIGGGLTSGIGGLMGGAGGGAGGSAGAAGSAVGDGLTTASEAMLNPAAAAAPGATTVGDIASQTAMNQVGALTPELATQAAAPSSSLFGGFGGDLSEMAVKEGLGMMKPEQSQAVAPRSGGGGGRPKSRYDEEQQQGFGNPFANPFGGFAEGGLTTLKGGGISMREGQYVIPADVVSAIGNGSSKAGAKFLEQAFNHYIQNGPPEGVKPQKRAGSLAEQRMQERVQREAA